MSRACSGVSEVPSEATACRSRPDAGNHVDIALDEDNVPRFGLFSQIQPEKVVAFAKTGVSGLLRYFGSPSPRIRPEKATTLPRTSMTGRHQPISEGVVHAAAPPLLGKTGLAEFALQYPFCFMAVTSASQPSGAQPRPKRRAVAALIPRLCI